MLSDPKEIGLQLAALRGHYPNVPLSELHDRLLSGEFAQRDLLATAAALNGSLPFWAASDR